MFLALDYLAILLERRAFVMTPYRKPPILSSHEERRLDFLRHLIASGKMVHEHEADGAITVDAEGHIHQRPEPPPD